MTLTLILSTIAIAMGGVGIAAGGGAIGLPLLVILVPILFRPLIRWGQFPAMYQRNMQLRHPLSLKLVTRSSRFVILRTPNPALTPSAS